MRSPANVDSEGSKAEAPRINALARVAHQHELAIRWKRCKELQVRETKDRVIVLDGRKEVVSHEKKAPGQTQPALPRPAGAPQRQKKAKLVEEGKLRALGEPLIAYLEALKEKRGPRYFWSVRKLWRLLCQYRAEDLKSTVAKALKHRLFDVTRLETVLLQDLAQKDYQLPLGFDAQDCEDDPQYRAGAATPEPDMKDYIPDVEGGDDVPEGTLPPDDLKEPDDGQ